MKRTFWDVLLDCNTYRVFTTGWNSRKILEFDHVLQHKEHFGKNWPRIKLKLWSGEDQEQEQKKTLADFMDTGLAIEAISQRGKHLLQSLTVAQVEFLPFETPVGPYYGLHVRYVDCLDVKRAEVIRFKSSGRIMEVTKYAFHWERLEDVHIFRLPELGLSRLFVSDEFRRVVEENHLTGLLFYPVPLVGEK